MTALKIKTEFKLSKFKQWLFALVQLDSRRMFWFWASVLFFQQILSVSIEYAVWGEHFAHWGGCIIHRLDCWSLFLLSK